MDNIHFWNGNKTLARKKYELALLEACLHATYASNGPFSVKVNETDYPKAEDEGNIFSNNNVDVLVTVAGNVKFADKQKIILQQPLAKGLLGHRLFVIRQASIAAFKQVKQLSDLKRFSVGIPATWADAELYRHNHFKVIEKGSLSDIFKRLQQGEFDFLALGANEIEDVVSQYPELSSSLTIESSIMIYYPFPLLFYVNQNNPHLASRISSGLRLIQETGEFERLFTEHHGDVVQRLGLKKRKVFPLVNPQLPQEMHNITASLLCSDL